MKEQQKQYIPDALAEAKEAYKSAYNMSQKLQIISEGFSSRDIDRTIQFAQTAALIAIAESLQKEKQ